MVLSPKAAERVKSAWREKIFIGALVGVICTLAYRTLQGHGYFAVDMRASCPTWRVLSFHQAWTWPYLSMFALVGCAWMALPDARAVRRFAGSMLAVAAVGWFCFLFFPTGCVRPEIMDPTLAYRWLVALDQPTNCFPCLHSAFSVLAAVVIARAWPTPAARIVLGSWVVVIAVSIIALRQHTDLDTLTGLILGAGGAWFDGRRAVNN